MYSYVCVILSVFYKLLWCGDIWVICFGHDVSSMNCMLLSYILCVAHRSFIPQALCSSSTSLHMTYDKAQTCLVCKQKSVILMFWHTWQPHQGTYRSTLHLELWSSRSLPKSYFFDRHHFCSVWGYATRWGNSKAASHRDKTTLRNVA